MVEALGSDWDKRFLQKVRDGVEMLNDHAHPTVEGATQVWDPRDPDRRIFGGSFSDAHCRLCMTWGLSSGQALLEELGKIDDQGMAWENERILVGNALGPWLQNHQV